MNATERFQRFQKAGFGDDLVGHGYQALKREAVTRGDDAQLKTLFDLGVALGLDEAPPPAEGPEPDDE